jgi:ABC-type multidrug transport system ATPase subunit
LTVGRCRLTGISFAAQPATLTAIIGPSGAGKTTLAKLIAADTLHPTTGSVTFNGHDIHGQYACLRNRIGLVPQDDGSIRADRALRMATADRWRVRRRRRSGQG